MALSGWKNGWWRLAQCTSLAVAIGAAPIGPAGMRAAADPPRQRVARESLVAAAVPSRIEPSATAIPANTLRFYVHFTANARGLFRQAQVTLAEASGQLIDGAFMNFGQELWSADGRRLTLLIDPGRIKRGVTAGLEEGPVLSAGRRYRLTVAWTAAAGQARSLTRTYDVGTAELTALDTRAWSVDPPVAATRSPLAILFDRPMDEALLVDSLAVADVNGRALPGSVAVENGKRWTFTPDEPWGAGPHRVLVMDSLEDVSGNRIGEALDHEVGTATAGPQSTSLAFLPLARRQ